MLRLFCNAKCVILEVKFLNYLECQALVTNIWILTRAILKGLKSALFVSFGQCPCSWIQESQINVDPHPKTQTSCHLLKYLKILIKYFSYLLCRSANRPLPLPPGLALLQFRLHPLRGESNLFDCCSGFSFFFSGPEA